MNRRLLIIDDDSSSRMFMTDVFESMGCAVSVASNGLDGLRYALTERYDVIITDMVMPGTGGAEIIAELRKSGMDTPIIAITGYSDGEARLSHAKEYKVDGVVYKPFIARELCDAIEQAIKNRKFESMAG